MVFQRDREFSTIPGLCIIAVHYVFNGACFVGRFSLVIFPKTVLPPEVISNESRVRGQLLGFHVCEENLGKIFAKILLAFKL